LSRKSKETAKTNIFEVCITTVIITYYNLKPLYKRTRLLNEAILVGSFLLFSYTPAGGTDMEVNENSEEKKNIYDCPSQIIYLYT